MKRIGIALFLLPLLALFPRTAHSGSLEPQGPASKKASESWNYLFHFPGKDIHAYLSLTRIWEGGDQCLAVLSISGGPFRDRNVTCGYPAKNFLYDSASMALSIHREIGFSGKLPGTHKLRFYRKKDGVTYRLVLEFLDVKGGDGEMFRVKELPNGARVGLSMPIPMARVKGFVAVNRDSLPVEGFGAMDHLYLSHPPTEMLEFGCRFNSGGGPGSSGIFLKTKKKYGSMAMGNAWRQSDSGKTQFMDLQDLKFGGKPTDGVPGSMELLFRGEASLKIGEPSVGMKWQSMGSQGLSGSWLAKVRQQVVFLSGTAQGARRNRMVFCFFTVE